MYFVKQYGRQNIEHVRKRNGNWTVESEDSEDEGGGSPSVPKKDKPPNKSADKKLQNGSAVAGNTVIARSKDLIMVPEPEMQNNHDMDETPDSTTANDDSHLSASAKEVCYLFWKLV